MAVEFRLAIGDPKVGKTYKLELKGQDAEKLIGKKIGDKFSGAIIGATGYELEITGGSDKSGFSMIKGISGGSRKTSLLSGGTGFRPKRKGERRRKTVVGNTVSDSIKQINCKILKEGKESIVKLLGIEVKDAKEGDKSVGGETAQPKEAPAEKVEAKPPEEKPKESTPEEQKPKDEVKSEEPKESNQP